MVENLIKHSYPDITADKLATLLNRRGAPPAISIPAELTEDVTEAMLGADEAKKIKDRPFKIIQSTFTFIATLIARFTVVFSKCVYLHFRCYIHC